MMASATALTRASRALMRRTTTIHRLFPAMTRPFTLIHSRALFFSSIAGIRQAIADGEQEPVQVTDRSLIAPWFHELDDMPEERMCIVAPSTALPAFPAMPVGDRDHHSHTITQPKYAVTPTPTSSGKRWIHSSTTLYSPPDHPAPPATPYASDDPTQPGFDRNKQIRSQAAWQETQQAGIACPLTPPVEPADTDTQKPVADASNPTNAYGKLHPDDTGGRGHIGLGEHEYMAPAATRPTGNWDDTDSAAKETKIHVPDTLPEADAADEQVLPQKPEDFVGACVAWHPVASMLFGASPAAATTRVQYHYDVARGYATNAKPQVMPKVSEIVNPAGEGGAKPRIRQSMQETVRVKSAVNPVKTRTYTGVEDGGQQQQVGADEAEEYQDGAIRNPHKELSGN